MKRDKAINRALSIFFTILSLAWIYPVFMIALNSFKKATAISTTTARSRYCTIRAGDNSPFKSQHHPIKILFYYIVETAARQAPQGRKTQYLAPDSDKNAKL